MGSKVVKAECMPKTFKGIKRITLVVKEVAEGVEQMDKNMKTYV